MPNSGSLTCPTTHAPEVVVLQVLPLLDRELGERCMPTLILHSARQLLWAGMSQRRTQDEQTGAALEHVLP